MDCACGISSWRVNCRSWKQWDYRFDDDEMRSMRHWFGLDEIHCSFFLSSQYILSHRSSLSHSTRHVLCRWKMVYESTPRISASMLAICCSYTHIILLYYIHNGNICVRRTFSLAHQAFHWPQQLVAHSYARPRWGMVIVYYMVYCRAYIYIYICEYHGH